MYIYKTVHISYIVYELYLKYLYSFDRHPYARYTHLKLSIAPDPLTRSSREQPSGSILNAYPINLCHHPVYLVMLVFLYLYICDYWLYIMYGPIKRLVYILYILTQ